MCRVERSIDAMKQVTVVLPDDVAERMEEHVRSGEYANSEEVVVESLRDYLGEPEIGRISGLADYIRTHVVPAVERAEHDPSRRRVLDDIVDRFRQRRADEPH